VSGAGDLYANAKELLDFCVVALDELPAGAPERRYVAVGLPAWDCEQLTVHVQQVGEAPTVPQASPMDLLRRVNPYPRVNLAFLVVSIVRECYPGPVGPSGGPTVPEVADLVAAAEKSYADAWQLWSAIPQGRRDGALWESCDFVGWQPLQPAGPSGDMVGWTFPLQLRIDGFVPPPPV
jgi:hypothetical protein